MKYYCLLLKKHVEIKEAHFTAGAAGTHHVEEHDDAEVDADCRTRGRHLRVIPDEGPAEGGEGADGDHPVNDDAKYSSDHHQDL